jgi:predicted RNA-binding Zn ribbon-like protein
VKRLRECIWRIWTAVQGGDEPAAPDLALLTREVIAAQRARLLTWAETGCVWRWTEAAGLDAVTARLALAVAELLAGEQLHRVRECEGRHCGWLFLDTTRNGTRRWCTAEECGSLARVTRFRARRKAAEQG